LQQQEEEEEELQQNEKKNTEEEEEKESEEVDVDESEHEGQRSGDAQDDDDNDDDDEGDGDDDGDEDDGAPNWKRRRVAGPSSSSSSPTRKTSPSSPTPKTSPSPSSPTSLSSVAQKKEKASAAPPTPSPPPSPHSNEEEDKDDGEYDDGDYDYEAAGSEEASAFVSSSSSFSSSSSSWAHVRKSPPPPMHQQRRGVHGSSNNPLAYLKRVAAGGRVKVDDTFAKALSDLADAVADEVQADFYLQGLAASAHKGAYGGDSSEDDDSSDDSESESDEEYSFEDSSGRRRQIFSGKQKKKKKKKKKQGADKGRHRNVPKRRRQGQRVATTTTVRRQLLRLCGGLAAAVSRTYRLIAGEGAPAIKLRQTYPRLPPNASSSRTTENDDDDESAGGDNAGGEEGGEDCLEDDSDGDGEWRKGFRSSCFSSPSSLKVKVKERRKGADKNACGDGGGGGGSGEDEDDETVWGVEHPWVGMQVIREFHRDASSSATSVGAATTGETAATRSTPRPLLVASTVVGWLSAEENEGLALWHVRHEEDGDEEDLEAHEVEAAIKLFEREGKGLSEEGGEGNEGGGSEDNSEEEEEEEEEAMARTTTKRVVHTRGTAVGTTQSTLPSSSTTSPMQPQTQARAHRGRTGHRVLSAPSSSFRPRPPVSPAGLAKLKTLCGNLRQALDVADPRSDSALAVQRMQDANRMVCFAEGSRAKRRFMNSAQGGSSAYGQGGGALHCTLRPVDCPDEVSPKLEVVRQCLRNEVCEDHDMRLRVDAKVVSDHSDPLFGELEVVATADIEAGEMGPYAGVLLRDDEVLTHLGQKPRVFLRAMHFWYSVLFDNALDHFDAGKDLHCVSSKSSAMRDTFSLFPFSGNSMALVNDFCGPDRSEANKERCQEPNCKYQTIKANGWPYVFVMATKDIKAGEALRADYGDSFWETWAEVVKVERQVDEAARVLFETLDALEVVAKLSTRQLGELA